MQALGWLRELWAALQVVELRRHGSRERQLRACSQGPRLSSLGIVLTLQSSLEGCSWTAPQKISAGVRPLVRYP